MADLKSGTPDQVPRAPLVPSFRRAGTAALFSRGVVMAAGFANSLLLPLVLDQRGVGQYFLSQLVIAGLATFCQLGLTYSIPGSVTDAIARNDLGRARWLTVAVLLLSTGVGAVVATAAVAVSPLVVSLVDATARSTWTDALPLVAAIAPLAALTALLVELLRAMHDVRASANLAALASIFAAGYAGLVLVTGGQATLTGALFAILLGSCVCVALALVLVWVRMEHWPRSGREPVDVAVVMRETLPNLLTTLVFFGLANFDMLVLGSLGNLEEVAQYGLALRFSAVILVPLGIANAAVAPLAVHARSTGDVAAVRGLLNGVVTTGAGAAAVLYAGFVAGAYSFIRFWDPSYQNTYWLTLILGLGNVLHACGGAAGILLMVWGDQKRAFAIALWTGALTVVLCVLSYRFGGMFGLAFAAAFGNVFQVACFVMRVRVRFKLDPSLAGRWHRRPPLQAEGSGLKSADPTTNP